MNHAVDGSMLIRARLFAGLDAKALDEAARACHLVRLSAASTVFEQEDAAEAFYVVIAGRVRIAQVTAEGHQVTIRYIGPGEMFGAVPLFTHTGYPAAASAVVDSVAARWDRAVTQRLMERYPRIVSNALAIVGARLQELQDRYRELATERVEQRVARAVLRLLGPVHGNPAAEMRIEFPISRQDIAEMTGATLHTVSRIFSGWEHRGLLESGRMRIVIRDPEALSAIADDLRNPVLPLRRSSAAADRA